MQAIHYRIIVATLLILLTCVYFYKSSHVINSHTENYSATSTQTKNVVENSLTDPSDIKVDTREVFANEHLAVGPNDTSKSKNPTAISNQKNPPDASFFVKSDYAGYDDNTLLNLISMEDTIAMQIMATRLYARGGSDNLTQAEDLLERSIIKGDSYYPLALLAEQKAILILGAIKQGLVLDEPSKRASLTDAFAYYELAAARGDDTLKRSMTQLYAEQYELSPTPEEWQEIHQKSITLQQHLDSKQKSLGL